MCKMAACNVCISEYNNSTRKQVECAKCGFDACVACYKRYLCEQTGEPACMGCRTDWNMEFLTRSFPMKFITDALKKHRENQLFERELSLLPSTQDAVKREMQIRKYMAKRRNLENAKRAKAAILRDMTATFGNVLYQLRPVELVRMDQLRMEMMDLTLRIRQVKAKQNEYRARSQEATERPTYVRHCPVADCRGFVDNKWKCGLCSARICKKCHEPKEEEHQCKPEDVETATLLTRDSKPCPGCGALICKLSGCNQMWCVNCGVAFDWVTLRIDRGHVHNPEYFKALQNGKLPFAQQNNNTDVCGRNLPADYEVISHVNGTNASLDTKDLLIETFRHIRHITHMSRPYYVARLMEGNQDLRVRYMLKDLDELKFKRLLQQREKSNNKNQEILQVIDMVLNISTGLFHDLLQTEDVVHIENKRREFWQLLEYGEECMQQISKRYNCQVPMMEIVIYA